MCRYCKWPPGQRFWDTNDFSSLHGAVASVAGHGGVNSAWEAHGGGSAGGIHCQHGTSSLCLAPVGYPWAPRPWVCSDEGLSRGPEEYDVKRRVDLHRLRNRTQSTWPKFRPPSFAFEGLVLLVRLLFDPATGQTQQLQKPIPLKFQ